MRNREVFAMKTGFEALTRSARCKAVLIVVVLSTTALLTTLLIQELRRQSLEDRSFVKANLQPLAEWIITFRDANQRLPTNEEFAKWADGNHKNKAVWYYPKMPVFMSEWGDAKRDFVVGAWRGESVLYYRSWDGMTFDGDIN